MAIVQAKSMGVLVAAAVLAAYAAGAAQTMRTRVGSSANTVNMQTTCSAGSLDGGYGISYSGFLVDSAGVSTPTTMVGSITFDGMGGIPNVTRTVILGGVVETQVGVGTYQVAPNCVGTATVNFSTVGPGGTTTPFGSETFGFVIPKIDSSEFKFTITGSSDPPGIDRGVNIVALGDMQSFF